MRREPSKGLTALATIAVAALTAATAQAATLKVTATADGYVENGKCGLREAVEAANLNEPQSGCVRRGRAGSAT